MAIAPVDLILDVKAALIDNQNGTQRFHAEYVKTKFKFRKCEFVFNPESPDAPVLAKDEPTDSDEEYDDADEELDEEDARRLFADNGKRWVRKSNY